MKAIDKRSLTSPVNGKHGGVKTQEGKTLSSQNATKHGIFAKYATALDDISFEETYEAFATEFDDSTPSRAALITQLTILWMRIRRCARFESEFIREKLNPPKFESRLVSKGLAFDLQTEDEYETILIEPGEPMTLNPAILTDLDNLYTKYECTFQRRFCQIVGMLTQRVE